MKSEQPLLASFLYNNVRRRNPGFHFLPRLKELKYRTLAVTLVKRQILLGKLKRTIMSIFGVRFIKLIPRMGTKLRVKL